MRTLIKILKSIFFLKPSEDDLKREYFLAKARYTKAREALKNFRR
jgi:hypothetical protein